MLTPASGSISLAESILSDMIANCETFQTEVGAANAGDALSSIYFGSLPPPADGAAEHTREELEDYRPFALVYSDETSTIHLAMRGVDASGHRFAGAGNLKFYFEMDICGDDKDDAAEAERQFKNACGNLLDELAELAGRAGYIAADTIQFSGPVRTHPDDVQDVGDFHCGFFELTYNNQGGG